MQRLSKMQFCLDVLVKNGLKTEVFQLTLRNYDFFVLFLQQ